MNYQFEDLCIIYAGDPLCSWCWGMAEELSSFKESVDMPFHTIVGGLRPGTVNEMTDQERSFIRHHWVEVNSRTGQPINFDLIDQKKPFIYDTEVPCRAVVAVRIIDPSKALQFFKSIQNAFYVENRDTNDEKIYEPLLIDIGLNYNQFLENFQSEGLRKATNDDFMWCRNVGANSFPTVILKKKHEYHALSIGYSTQKDMETRMKHILSEK